jgi:RNA polymerase sigma factor (TIGR02999 family)
MLRRLGDRGGHDPSAAAELLSVIRTELERIVAAQVEPQPVAALLGEAYRRLVIAEGLRAGDRAQFLALAARAMRRVMVDAARGRRTAPPPGILPRLGPVEDARLGPNDPTAIRALDVALDSLRTLDGRAARVAEMRLFGGLGFAEIESALGASGRMVVDDWAMARIWLARELRSLQG